MIPEVLCTSWGSRVYLDSWLVAAPWAAVVAYVLLALLDWRLTIVGARIYQGGAIEHVEYEGSYEANPRFVEDVNRLAPHSRRHLVAVAIVAACLGFATLLLSDPFGRALFLVVAGASTVPGVLLAWRHLTSIHTLRRAAGHNGVEGHVRFTRWYGHESLAVWALGSALLVLGAAAAASSLALLGGGLFQLRIGLQYLRLSRRERAQAARASGGQPAASTGETGSTATSRPNLRGAPPP